MPDETEVEKPVVPLCTCRHMWTPIHGGRQTMHMRLPGDKSCAHHYPPKLILPASFDTDE